jgi:hypothetical protein
MQRLVTAVLAACMSCSLPAAPFHALAGTAEQERLERQREERRLDEQRLERQREERRLDEQRIERQREERRLDEQRIERQREERRLDEQRWKRDHQACESRQRAQEPHHQDPLDPTGQSPAARRRVLGDPVHQALRDTPVVRLDRVIAQGATRVLGHWLAADTLQILDVHPDGTYEVRFLGRQRLAEARPGQDGIRVYVGAAPSAEEPCYELFVPAR